MQFIYFGSYIVTHFSVFRFLGFRVKERFSLVFVDFSLSSEIIQYLNSKFVQKMSKRPAKGTTTTLRSYDDMELESFQADPTKNLASLILEQC